MPIINARRLWLQALTRASVWRRAVIVGLAAGSLQIALHQGDVILRDGLSIELMAKCAISPLIGIAVALASAAWVYVEREQTKHTIMETS